MPAAASARRVGQWTLAVGQSAGKRRVVELWLARCVSQPPHGFADARVLICPGNEHLSGAAAAYFPRAADAASEWLNGTAQPGDMSELCRVRWLVQSAETGAVVEQCLTTTLGNPDEA
eukprot:jgi/Tetstr1/441953/TSEL_030158.t1